MSVSSRNNEDVTRRSILLYIQVIIIIIFLSINENIESKIVYFRLFLEKTF